MQFIFLTVVNYVIFSRPPLAEIIREEFVSRIPTAVFTTNPCRIQYGTKEIVVLREDILTKMCRNAIHFPTSDDIPQQVIFYLIYLKPLTFAFVFRQIFLSICPVKPNYFKSVRQNLNVARPLVSPSWRNLPCLLAL